MEGDEHREWAHGMSPGISGWSWRVYLFRGALLGAGLPCLQESGVRAVLIVTDTGGLSEI